MENKKYCQFADVIQADAVTLKNIYIELTNDYTDLQSIKYISSNIPGPGIDHSDFMVQYCGCDCQVEDGCSSETCSCIKRFGPNYSESGLLASVFNSDNDVDRPVLECNSNCRCSQKCNNRQVQKGIQSKLCIFKTQKKGWGLMTLELIPKGSFVCEYIGEVIDYCEVERRIKNKKLLESNYILNVKEHLSSGKILNTYIDPVYTGNIGRFINHSCNPNLLMQPVRIDCPIPKMCLFAKTDISPEEELTYNYSGDKKISHKTENLLDNDLQTTENIKRKPCYCSSSECQGYLPWDDISVLDQ